MMRWKKQYIDWLGGILAVCVLAIGFVGARGPIASGSHLPAPVLTEVLHPRAPLTDDMQSNLSFAVDSLCRIIDPAHSLDQFLEELDMLMQGKDTTIQIVHLGDSHVQAGFYTGETMRLLHDAFGNAGRGWIAPYKLARDNEPNDYFITSTKVKNWTVGRCTRNLSEGSWGPGAIGIQTNASSVDFTVSIAPNNGAGYEFSQAILYRGERALPLLPEGMDDNRENVVWGTEASSPGVIVDTFKLSNKTSELRLQSVPRSSRVFAQSASASYYGFVLTNGQPGILYHSVGQNGAMFVNYTNSEYIRQLSLLDPSLLIITLGTNETFGSRFSTSEFLSQVDRFVKMVKHYLPFTTLVLTTPAESYRSVRIRRRKRRYKRNENIGLVARAIKDYAMREGIACFDLYGMTGGSDSCSKWLNSSYLGRDRIHFNVAGYQEQGKLLYKALIRSELDYQKRKRQ